MILDTWTLSQLWWENDTANEHLRRRSTLVYWNHLLSDGRDGRRENDLVRQGHRQVNGERKCRLSRDEHSVSAVGSNGYIGQSTCRCSFNLIRRWRCAHQWANAPFPVEMWASMVFTRASCSIWQCEEQLMPFLFIRPKDHPWPNERESAQLHTRHRRRKAKLSSSSITQVVQCWQDCYFIYQSLNEITHHIDGSEWSSRTERQTERATGCLFAYQEWWWLSRLLEEGPSDLLFVPGKRGYDRHEHICTLTECSFMAPQGKWIDIVVRDDTELVRIHRKSLHVDRHKWREKHQLTKDETVNKRQSVRRTLTASRQRPRAKRTKNLPQ